MPRGDVSIVQNKLELKCKSSLGCSQRPERVARALLLKLSTMEIRKLPDLISKEEADVTCCCCLAANAIKRCAPCKQNRIETGYCNVECQTKHWSEHKPSCKPWMEMRNDQIRRYGVAARDLEAGEFILSEMPVAWGPKLDSYPMCLGCYTPVDCSVLCENCGWPVCGPDCQNLPDHKENECSVFRAAGSSARFQVTEEPWTPTPQLECIVPLRLLLASEKDQERWKKEVEPMESHNEKRKQLPLWNANQVNTVNFLRERCKMDRFTEELIHTICGILEVNSFEIQLINGAELRALYPKTALYSHDCVSNTSHGVSMLSDDPKKKFLLTLRTTIPVQKGRQLFTSYTSSLAPTIQRRENLLGKYFECACARCSDPTELGTQFGSFKCSKCDPGLILSTDSLDAKAIWKCTHCEFQTKGEQVSRALAVMGAEISQVEALGACPQALEMFEQLSRKYRSILYPKHAIHTQLRHSLCHLYGRIETYDLDSLPDVLLERKIDICKQILEVANVIEPGYTRLRATTLYEMHAPELLLAQKRFHMGECSLAQSRANLEEAAKHLEEAYIILSFEDPLTPEGSLALIAKRSLAQLKASLQAMPK